jgi:DNA-binding transcriptional ArsR family regulator
MTMHTNSIETATSDVFRAILAEESGEVFAVGLDEEATEDLITILTELDDPPRVRLVARESVLKWVRDDFVLASAAAELGAATTLSLGTTDDRFENGLVVTEETVVSVVPAGGYVAGLVTDDGEFVEAARTHWSEVWESAEEFDLRTPARSQVEESLTAEFGPDVEADFHAMLGALGTARSDEIDLDEVAVSLLAAAKHEELLYDVSKWGEDVGVASKPTFSRTKTRLEEMGLIDTEKVPIDVGRPRLRLILGDERLRGADADELASAAQSLLSTAEA